MDIGFEFGFQFRQVGFVGQHGRVEAGFEDSQARRAVRRKSSSLLVGMRRFSGLGSSTA